MQWIGASFIGRQDEMMQFSLESFFSLNEEQIRHLLDSMNINEFIKLDNKYGKSLFEQLLEYDGKIIGDPHSCDISTSDNSSSSVSSYSLKPFIPSNNQNHCKIRNIVESLVLRVNNGGKVLKPQKKSKLLKLICCLDVYFDFLKSERLCTCLAIL
jgi:hypothetical protein